MAFAETLGFLIVCVVPKRADETSANAENHTHTKRKQTSLLVYLSITISTLRRTSYVRILRAPFRRSTQSIHTDSSADRRPPTTIYLSGEVNVTNKGNNSTGQKSRSLYILHRLKKRKSKREVDVYQSTRRVRVASRCVRTT